MFNLSIIVGLALAPGVAIMSYIYYRDRIEKEPVKVLIICFLLGMISIVPAVVFEIVGEHFSDAINNFYGSNFIKAFFVVALAEEYCKFAMLKLYPYKLKSFDEPFDGIVYAVFISMGFATLENLMYVIDGGIEVGVWRMFTAVPSHAVNAVLMGHFVGLQKLYPQRKYLQWIGLFLAVLFHGSYDFFLFISNESLIYLGAFAALITGLRYSFKAMALHKDLVQRF